MRISTLIGRFNVAKAANHSRAYKDENFYAVRRRAAADVPLPTWARFSGRPVK